MNTPSLNLYSLYGFAPRNTFFPTHPQYPQSAGLVEESPSVVVANEISSYALIVGVAVLVGIRLLQDNL